MSATPILDLLTVIDIRRPLSMGQIRLNEDGVLEVVSTYPPPVQEAKFIWCGFPVNVSLHPDELGGVTCDIMADMGLLPFSAQNTELRAVLLAILRGFRPPKDARLMLGPRSVIWASQQTTLTSAVTPAAVLAEIAVFLHGMNPVMMLVRDLRAAYEGRQRTASPLHTQD